MGILTDAILKGAVKSMAFPAWLIPIIGQLLKVLTPTLSTLLRDFALQFYARARETSNPFDDVAASLLLGILGINTPDPN